MENNDQKNDKDMTVEDLSVVAINIISTIANQRRATLRDLLQREKPDFALLGKTKSNKCLNISFKGYSILRADRKNEKNGGGTAIVLKDPIKYERIYPNCLEKNICTEATIAKIKLANNNSLFTITVYVAGNHKKEFITELDSLF